MLLWCEIPALLTRKSNCSRPPDFLQCALQRADELGKGFNGARVELQRDRLASLRLDGRHDFPRLIGARVVGDHQVDALAGEACRGIAAEPPAAASDQSDFRSSSVLLDWIDGNVFWRPY